MKRWKVTYQIILVGERIVEAENDMEAGDIVEYHTDQPTLLMEDQPEPEDIKIMDVEEVTK